MNSPSAENASDLIIVARGVRTRGLKGEIVAELLTDFPDRFESISTMLAIAGEEIKRLELEDHWFQNERIILKFIGYDDVAAAKSLIGFDFALPEAERVQLSQDAYYDWELEGCSVLLKDGAKLGTVSSVMRTGGVELLVVEDDDKHECLIPMAQPIVVEIDVANRKVVIDPPEGLLDL